MRNLAVVLCFCVFTFVGCSSQTISTVVAPSVETMSADELNAFLTTEENYVFVDVRSVEEIQNNGTVEGYIHIPIGEFEQRADEIPRGKKVVVACARGARAGRGASILQKRGYTDVYSVGLTEYKAKGYALIYPKLSSGD